MDTLVGTSISGYTLVKLLGTGGMGSVYLATDPAVGQQVAVKLIRTELDGFADSAAARLALERFRQEARAVAGLDHLHILPLYRYGEEQTAQGSRAYMIMQYRPEGSLWDWLRRRADYALGQQKPTQAEIASGLPVNWPLSLDEATDYLQQAASALQYAHDRSIVHRDIKPANFLLRFDKHERQAYLLLGDFGLAKVFTGSSATQTILGTPTYMAPEQFEGAARPESDQYALAIMIYYLLAGRPPFEGDPMQLMRQHMVAPVPAITSFNAEVPPAINEVLACALSKQPEQRFPSIADFAETFANVAKQARSGQPQIIPGRPGQPYAANSAPGLSRGGAANLAAGAQLSPKPLVLPGPAERNYQQPSPLSPMAYPPQGPAQSYPPHTPTPQTAGGAYGTQQYGQRANTPDVYARTPDVYAQPPAFASLQGHPSGYSQQGMAGAQAGGRVDRRGAIGWILGGAALVIVAGGAGVYAYMSNNLPGVNNGSGGTTGGPALYILKGHTGSVTSLSLLSNGSQLATGSLDQSIRLWSTADGTLARTIQAGSPVNALAWSPDGSKLATGHENKSVNLWGSNGSEIHHEGNWGAPIKTFSWRSDGNLLFLGTAGNGLHALDVANFKHYGRNAGLLIVNAITQSPDGTRMALALESGRVYFADLKNDWVEVASITPAHGVALSIAWSPDGGSVAVGYADNYAVVYDAASQKVQYLLKHKGPVQSIAWKPDSTAASPMLVTGAGDGTVNFWNVAKNAQIVYTGHSAAVQAVAWGTNVIASASQDQTAILWQQPAF